MPRRAAEGSFTHAILQFLRRAGTERSTARLVAEMFRFFGSAFAMHRVSVFLASGEGRRLVPFVSEMSTGDADPKLFWEWKRVDPEQFEVVRQIRAGEDVVMVEDPATGLGADVADHYGLQPLLALALRRDAELVGVLMVESTPESLRLHRDEIAEFAQYLAMALANAKAFEREQRRARDAEALLEVGAVLAETTELSAVLAAVAQNCARVSNFDRCSVFLVDEETGRLQATMSQFADGHRDADAWELFITTELELPAAREVLRTGEPLAFSDTSLDPDLNPPGWVDAFGIRSVLYLPLTAWGQQLGVLAMDRGRVKRISDPQIRVAQGVAAQGAVAIGLSRLLARERAAKARLEELDDLKTTFVAAVSHELRTPLTTIIGFGSVLDSHLADDEGREFLDIIQREAVHLENLISNLLLVSNLEAGVLELRRERVDVSEVVREAADLIARLSSGHEILVDVADGLVVEEGDAGCLRQVFINLVQNAAKYSHAGSQIEVSASGSNGIVRVEVTDRGPGIDPDEREAVFERFHRGRAQGVQGTGIGLFLVRELVEGHAGRVWVEAGPGGVGARFVTLLPISASSESAA
jgi:K+-sensing histidine kinase KdpD